MGTVILDTYKTVEMELQIIKYMNYVSIFVATVFRSVFFLSKEGGLQTLLCI